VTREIKVRAVGTHTSRHFVMFAGFTDQISLESLYAYFRFSL